MAAPNPNPAVNLATMQLVWDADAAAKAVMEEEAVEAARVKAEAAAAYAEWEAEWAREEAKEAAEEEKRKAAAEAKLKKNQRKRRREKEAKQRKEEGANQRREEEANQRRDEEEKQRRDEEAKQKRDEEAEQKRDEEEKQKRDVKTSTKMNRQKRQKQKERKAKKTDSAFANTANTDAKKQKKKKKKPGLEKSDSTIPHETHARSGELESAQDEVSSVVSPPSKHQTHLKTPNEADRRSSPPSGEAAVPQIMHDVLVNGDVGNPGVEVEVLGDARSTEIHEFGSQRELQNVVSENKEEFFFVQKEAQQGDGASMSEPLAQPHSVEEDQEQSTKVYGSATATTTSQLQTPNAMQDVMNQLRVTQEQMTKMEQAVEQKLSVMQNQMTKMKQAAGQKLSVMQNQMTKMEQAVELRVTQEQMTKMEQAVGQKLSVMQNQMTKMEQAVEQKLNYDAFNQLEKLINSKLEAIVPEQIKAHFQTMFEKMSATLQKGTAEHITASQHHFEHVHSPSGASSSASSAIETPSRELVDGHQEKVVGPLDQTMVVLRLVNDRNFGDALAIALQNRDVHLVALICDAVDFCGILAMRPYSLSQELLVSLLHLFANDINNDRPRKVAWMTAVLSCQMTPVLQVT